MHKSRIGNGLILGGVSALLLSPTLNQPYGMQIYFGGMLGGFIVGFLFPNF